MKTHYTAKEIAVALGITERAVQIMAARENWPSQKRAGRGGGREYPLYALPEAAQNHLTKALVAAAPVPATQGAADLPAIRSTLQPAKTTAQLKQWQREVMDARVGIIPPAELSETSALPDNIILLDAALPAGYKINVAIGTTVASVLHVTCEGGNF